MTKQQKLAILGFGVLALGGCNTDMWRQPKQEPLDESEFFADGAANRPLLPGTIARGHLREDDAYFVGASNGKWLDGFPAGVKVDRPLLDRGQERFNIYCSPCHGRLGDGQGMIAKRGFTLKRPVGNYHTDRLRKMPVGHFYDVITNGYGAMFSYASRIEPQDRWAIVAYIRALQLSQYSTPDLLRPEEVQNALSASDLSASAKDSKTRLAQK
jgi:mono/diheme cytochrome c family protein